MIADSSTHDEAGKLLSELVSVYNAGVRTRDFRAFLSMLSEDAVLEIEGTPERAPFEGKRAIAQHLADDPPDDPIRVKRWKLDGNRIVAEFAWMDIPEGGGCLFVRAHDGSITRVTLALGGPGCAAFR